MAIAIEMLQAAFLGLAAAVIAIEKRMKRVDKKTAGDSIYSQLLSPRASSIH